jgi:hypothetical protein
VDPALSKITVGEWLPLWLALQVKLKPTTMVRYEVALRRQILSRWELVPFPDHCLGRLELGARPGRRGTCVGNPSGTPRRSFLRPSVRLSAMDV